MNKIDEKSLIGIAALLVHAAKIDEKYSENEKSLIKKNESIPIFNFNQKDRKLLKSDDQVFSGTMNVLLREFGIFLQEVYLDSKKIELIVDQSNYRNLNI